MKVEFAPLNVPVRRRLQTAATLQWVFSFLALAQCCLAAFVLLALSDWWIVALLYAGWLWLDWDTPTCGGRRSQWVRSWGIWEFFRDYFPLTLIKTVDLDPKKNYIFGFHPHGVPVAVLTCLALPVCPSGVPVAVLTCLALPVCPSGVPVAVLTCLALPVCPSGVPVAVLTCLALPVCPSGVPVAVLTCLALPVCPSGVLVAGAFGNFCTEATGFSRLFPGLRSHLLMLPFWFRVPLFRDYIMYGEPVAKHYGSSDASVSCQRSFPVQLWTDAVQEAHPHRRGKADPSGPDSESQL
ncbi:2-acylglycerol O-acyltransferase 2-B isoform X4 [Anarhichas minor]|uniref:2-acylglycerol O-acyltransferase 2-B isoform X4 n=1 Tax=Anarhichas minor TaxID=65739 RepID=UPI003F73FF68